MAARAGRNGDQAVRTFLDRLVGEAIVDDVMQDEAAIGVNGLVDLLHRAERGDDVRNLVLHADPQIGVEPRVGAMHDLIDRERGRGALGMGGVVSGEGLLDLEEPVRELFGGAGVQRGKGADDPRAALCDRQRRVRDDEERGGDGRNAKALAKLGGQRHGILRS